MLSAALVAGLGTLAGCTDSDFDLSQVDIRQFAAIIDELGFLSLVHLHDEGIVGGREADAFGHCPGGSQEEESKDC